MFYEGTRGSLLRRFRHFSESETQKSNNVGRARKEDVASTEREVLTETKIIKLSFRTPDLPTRRSLPQLTLAARRDIDSMKRSCDSSNNEFRTIPRFNIPLARGQFFPDNWYIEKFFERRWEYAFRHTGIVLLPIRRSGMMKLLG